MGKLAVIVIAIPTHQTYSFFSLPRTTVGVAVFLVVVFGASVAFAAISFGSVSTAAPVGAPTTTLVIPAPSGIAAGHFLIAGIEYQGGTGETITPPAGWTLIERTDSGTSFGIVTYYRVADGSEGASFTWTFSVATRSLGGIIRYTGVDTASPIDVQGEATGSSATPTAPSVVTTQANDLVVAFWGDGATLGQTAENFTPPGGTTERYDITRDVLAGVELSTAAADVAQALAGASGTKVATTATSDAWVAQTIALKMAPSTGTLTLQKTVIKDNGGTANDTDWTLAASGPTPISGVEGNAAVTNASVNPGSYDLSESGGPSGYNPSAWVCVGDTQNDGDTVTIAAGQNVTCTITNDDVAPRLTLLKEVINDEGGSAAASDFQAYINSNPVDWGVPETLNAGTYLATEDAHGDYTDSVWGGDCGPDGSITLGVGENATCTVTNDDKPPSLERELPPPSPPSCDCGCACTPQLQTLVSNDSNTVVGDGNAVAVATSSAWTASIPDASWIWKSGATAPNETVAFEKSFTVSGTVLSAQLFVASDNSYKVFIDGVQVAADASATNFTLATQDVYNLTANVTPGVHTLRIEVTNNGTFSSLNPAGLLYKFEIKTCVSPSSPGKGGGITIFIRNFGCIINTTSAGASSGGNTAGGSYGGNGSSGGSVTANNGSNNNGGATGGEGGGGGSAGRGGKVKTGNANSLSTTTNDANHTVIRVER